MTALTWMPHGPRASIDLGGTTDLPRLGSCIWQARHRRATPPKGALGGHRGDVHDAPGAMPYRRGSCWVSGSYTPWASETRNAFIRSLKNTGLKENSGQHKSGCTTWFYPRPWNPTRASSHSGRRTFITRAARSYSKPEAATRRATTRRACHLGYDPALHRRRHRRLAQTDRADLSQHLRRLSRGEKESCPLLSQARAAHPLRRGLFADMPNSAEACRRA